MRRKIHKWWSPNLGKDTPVVSYGHYGFALLMFPTAAADFLEYERFQMIDKISHHIHNGKVKVYSINSINNESWFNQHIHPAQKAIRQQQYNSYIFNEVVPFIHNDCQGRVMIITCGISMGCVHAANALFHRPDLIDGAILMSGTYDLKRYVDNYYDDNVYFNNPVDYLPNLNDGWHLEQLRQKRHIHVLSGQGEYEDPQRSIDLANILDGLGVPCELDLWGHDMRHDWPTWYAMLPYYLESRF
ncbi:MAG: esterase [Candidatus Cloacimonetes bacterium 4572_55]|nr:MAG: esterase [Candidatus Cloacimonetes bacterium 4572_55]